MYMSTATLVIIYVSMYLCLSSGTVSAHSADGNLQRFIQKPKRFVIPNLYLILYHHVHTLLEAALSLTSHSSTD